MLKKLFIINKTFNNNNNVDQQDDGYYNKAIK